MSAEKKFHPKSDFTRQMALNIAKQMYDLNPAGDVLFPKTVIRLNAMQPLFTQLMNERAKCKAEAAVLLAEKEKAKEKAAMYCSHFVQGFNLGIKRGEYKTGDRAFYQLPVENEQVYPLKTEDDILLAGQHLLDGEAARLATGGMPMGRPSAAEVQLHYNAFKDLVNRGSTAKDALSAAQKALNKITPEADRVIRKVWREAEIFFKDGRKSTESMREHVRDRSRKWGVVYARKGHEKLVYGNVTNAATGLPLTGAKIKLLNGRNRVSTLGDGKFKLNTTLMHEQTLLVTCTGYETIEVVVKLEEFKDTFVELKMVVKGV